MLSVETVGFVAIASWDPTDERGGPCRVRTAAWRVIWRCGWPLPWMVVLWWDGWLWRERREYGAKPPKNGVESGSGRFCTVFRVPYFYSLLYHGERREYGTINASGQPFHTTDEATI